MASIPCAAYKASSLHQRRRSRTISGSSMDSVESGPPSRPASPSRAIDAAPAIATESSRLYYRRDTLAVVQDHNSANPESGGVMSLLRKKQWTWAQQRSKSQGDMSSNKGWLPPWMSKAPAGSGVMATTKENE